MKCDHCDDTGWVCENHEDRPWDGTSGRSDACGCGAGSPCPKCNPYHRDHPSQRRRNQMWEAEMAKRGIKK